MAIPQISKMQQIAKLLLHKLSKQEQLSDDSPGQRLQQNSSCAQRSHEEFSSVGATLGSICDACDQTLQATDQATLYGKTWKLYLLTHETKFM